MQHKPNLMFIHFDSIDHAGHTFTWGSAQYYNVVKVWSSILNTSQCHIHYTQWKYVGLNLSAFVTGCWWVYWRDHEGIWKSWDIQQNPVHVDGRPRRVSKECLLSGVSVGLHQSFSPLTVVRYMYGHGEPTQVCMYIPALFMGPQVKKGYQISGYATDKDFAPTALNALGLHPGEYMVGKVVEEIYET